MRTSGISGPSNMHEDSELHEAAHIWKRNHFNRPITV